MNLSVLNLNNPDEAGSYNAALNSLENNHPYYKIAFLDIFYDGLNNARAFVLNNHQNKTLVVMPFYLRPIENDLDITNLYFDVTSTWGYNGPLYNKSIDEKTLQLFWSFVDTWYKDNNVVSEFIRFNTSNNSIGYTGDVVPIMRIVKGHLVSIEEIWANYHRKVRKNINKAKREELTTKIYFQNITQDNLDTFHEIFIHTMERTNATGQYYNSKEKIGNFIKKHPENAAIALVYDNEGKAISSEAILLSKNKMYSFLGGTLSDYFNYRPNELLKHNAIEWGLVNGFKFFVLGGGLGKEDGIFKYKNAFFPEDTISFNTGRKILNHEVYDKLCKSRNLVEDGNTDFFPLYRKTP